MKHHAVILAVLVVAGCTGSGDEPVNQMRWDSNYCVGGFEPGSRDFQRCMEVTARQRERRDP